MITIDPRQATTEEILAEADRMVDDGRVLDAVEWLHHCNRVRPRPPVEIRLAALRHRAFDHLERINEHPTWPVPVDDLDLSGPAGVPRIEPSQLSAEAVRRAIAARGGVHVPGLVPAERVASLVEGIEHALALRESNRDTPHKRHSSWFSALRLPRAQAEGLARNWVAGDGGMLACDSPRLLELVLTTYEDVGLREVVTGYLGERPALSANKTTLRRARLDGGNDWHQDGAFLGSGIRALNVWVTLTDCGVEAPGMDLVPKRFETIQETGTGGAIFDWAVGPEVVAELSVDAPVVRPRFRAGDAMLFDDLYLHRTALEPTMTRTRHAVESWFFAPSAYPEGHVPLVW